MDYENGNMLIGNPICEHCGTRHPMSWDCKAQSERATKAIQDAIKNIKPSHTRATPVSESHAAPEKRADFTDDRRHLPEFGNYDYGLIICSVAEVLGYFPVVDVQKQEVETVTLSWHDLNRVITYHVRSMQRLMTEEKEAALRAHPAGGVSEITAASIKLILIDTLEIQLRPNDPKDVPGISDDSMNEAADAIIAKMQSATGIGAGVVPEGWQIKVDGDYVAVRRPDGTFSEWHERPKTNGTGMYDLCRALAASHGKE